MINAVKIYKIYNQKRKNTHPSKNIKYETSLNASVKGLVFNFPYTWTWD